MTSALEFYDKAFQISQGAIGVPENEAKSILMKAASFYQMAIKASPQPFPNAVGNLAVTLIRAGDESGIKYAVQAVKLDPDNLEGRWVICLRDLSECFGHQWWKPSSYTGDFTSQLAAGAVDVLVFGGLNLIGKGSKLHAAHNAVHNLSEAFKQNVAKQKYQPGYYLQQAGIIMRLAESFGYPTMTKSIFDAILASNWDALTLTEEQKAELSDLLIQAEGSILLLR